MKARISVPFEQFPERYKKAIRSLRHARRGRRAYSDASIASVVHAMGQFLHVVTKAGLEPELSHDGFGLFIDDLDERSLKSSSRLSYLASLQAVAKATDYPKGERKLILEDIGVYREAAGKETKRKVHNLALWPITLRDIAKAAIQARDEGVKASNPNTRRSNLQRAGILALLSLVPLRISDATSLVLGQTIHRDGARWFLDQSSGKSAFESAVPLHRLLTPYLDHLVSLEGWGSIDVDYPRRLGRPLFSTIDGQFLSKRTLAASFKSATGHSPHIVRTLVHDAMAEDEGEGAEVARILCGQITPAMGKTYEVHARRHRVARGQERIQVVQGRLLRGGDMRKVKQK